MTNEQRIEELEKRVAALESLVQEQQQFTPDYMHRLSVALGKDMRKSLVERGIIPK